ncbi:MAG: rod shape-determining protein MreC [Clostridia bacterium]
MKFLLKSKLFIVLLLTVLILIAMGVTAKKTDSLKWVESAGNVIVTPFQAFFTFCENSTSNFLSNFANAELLNKKNKKLQAEIDKLKNKNRELTQFETENKELRDMLNLKDQFFNFDTIGANLISIDLGNWFNVFTIDRGSRDKIKINSSVITSQGVVGKVIKNMPFSSKVESIIDSESSISAIISKSMDYVIVKGDINLESQGLCRMNQIPIDLDLSVGDTVETSGIGGIFPKGLLIGTVKEIVKGNSELERYAIIKPAVDFRRLQEVFVLISKK